MRLSEYIDTFVEVRGSDKEAANADDEGDVCAYLAQ
jgi:hypothetical protein